MKVAHYNQMMNWLTRPNGAIKPVNGDRIKQLEALRAHGQNPYIKKDKVSDPITKSGLRLNYTKDKIEDTDGEAVSIRDVLNEVEFDDLPTKHKKLVVAELPTKLKKSDRDKLLNKVAEKPNGKYKMPKSNFDSFDWDLWLREKDPNYQTLEEEDKLVSQPSIDESNATWWENMYYDYKKSGGELNFKQFQQMLNREGDIGDLDAKAIDNEINKRVAQQKRSEGIAYLLGETI